MAGDGFRKQSTAKDGDSDRKQSIAIDGNRATPAMQVVAAG